MTNWFSALNRSTGPRGTAMSDLPTNLPSHAANGTRGQATGGGIPPIPVDALQQPVVNLGTQPFTRATPPGTTPRRRGAGTGLGDGTTNAQEPLVIRTRDPHTEGVLAQYAMQLISAVQSFANDVKDSGGKIVDMFLRLLDITGTPR